MEKKKLTKGLKRILTATLVFGILYLAVFGVLAYFMHTSGGMDGGLFKYLLRNSYNLAIFELDSEDHLLYFAISVVFYALVATWLLFILAGLYVFAKKERKVLFLGILFTLLNVIFYLLVAVLSQKLLAYLNDFNGNMILFFLTVGLLAMFAVYFVLAVVAYFWCIVDAFLHPGNLEGNEHAEEERDEEPKKEQPNLRKLVREELDRNQPQYVGFEQPPLEPQVIVVKANGDVEVQPMSDEIKESIIIK